jgi:hypothetical protein
MDFGRFSSNFIEFGRFFWKPTGSEGADFLFSAGFLNTGWWTPEPAGFADPTCRTAVT